MLRFDGTARSGLWLALCTLICGAGAVAGESPELDPDHAAKMKRGLVTFESHVRPLLVQECLRCHGGEETESEFNLATREGLLKGGTSGKAIVPGNASASRLMQLLRHEAEPYMPMDASRLSDEQIAHVAEWINNLAPYDTPLTDSAGNDDWTQRTIAEEAREFWSFQPLADARPPNVTGAASDSPIDRFIVAVQREQGLTPNAPADRHVLIRRAYLDLLGLPPTWAQVESFVNSTDPAAWEQLVDSLLASPHYGERWGRHWLDLARFAESHGFEHDTDRQTAYHYRDFVIQALNAGMPYDRFVQYQLAGDELAPADPLALMATGFLAAGVHSTQITISEAERHRYDELDDMLNTACTAFLGMTVGCARCHDHKFDPIPQADYYRLLSNFTTTVRSEIAIDFDPAGYARDKATYDTAHAPLAAALEQYDTGPLRAKFDEWIATNPSIELPPWIILDDATLKSGRNATIEKRADGSFLVSGENPLRDTFTLNSTVDLRTLTGLRLEALAHRSLPGGGPGRADSGNFALSDLTVSWRPAGSQEGFQSIRLVDATATSDAVSADPPAATAIDADPLSAWGISGATGRDQVATFRFDQPVRSDQPVELQVVLQFSTDVRHALGCARFAVTGADPPADPHAPAIRQSIAAKLPRGEGEHTPEQIDALLELYRRQDPHWRELSSAVRAHEVQEPRPAIHNVLITSEGLAPLKLDTQAPREFYDETFFLKRGDVNQKVGVAPAGYLQAASFRTETEPPRESANPVAAPASSIPWTPPADWKTSGQRKNLALWMSDVDGGAGRLLARVIVNRLWQHHFGEGLVRTPSDFGKQGERPTHPELLDWLARQLIAHDWDLKAVHRLIMTSDTYRQSSAIDPAKLALDPDNRLLARYPRRRLEAECLRDTLLASTGRLDDEMYGRGTLDPAMTRRSIYFTVKRSELVPAMLVFDAPDALGGLGDRPTTTVAPQALYLMNNDQVRRCAASIAATLAEDADPVATAFRELVGRDPDANEHTRMTNFLQQQSQIHTAAGHADAPSRARTDLCQVLLSLNETVYIP